LFVAENLECEQVRLDARETVPAGPMYGRKTFAAASLAAEREAVVLAEAGLSRAAFTGFGKLLEGTRRHNLVYVDDLDAVCEETGVRFTFTLPAGSYATVLLRELTKSAQMDAAEESDDR
jgi:tRNA pseudouridine13 synthase